MKLHEEKTPSKARPCHCSMDGILSYYSNVSTPSLTISLAFSIVHGGDLFYACECVLVDSRPVKVLQYQCKQNTCKCNIRVLHFLPKPHARDQELKLRNKEASKHHRGS